MKAPQNFAQSLKGYTLTTKGKNYLLDVSIDEPNKVWIYPEDKSSIVTMLEFNWRYETFSINIAKPGDGEEFFKRIPPNKFDCGGFVSFDKIIKFMGWRADAMDKSIYNYLLKNANITYSC